MPQVDLPHERIGFCHHLQRCDDHDPDGCTEERRVDRQDNEDQDDRSQPGDQHEFAIRAKQEIRTGKGAVYPVALKTGAADTARYNDGVAVFVQPIGGLMFEAAVGGQQFSFVPR